MLSRRNFLKESIALVSFGLAVPGVFAKAAVAAAAENSAGTGRTLVVIQLQGGIDGLNVVIPYKNGAYRTNRPSLGIPESQMIPVDDRIAFHGAMTGFKDLFDQGKLAVVEGVGYPNPDFSHFRSMDIWQSGEIETKPRAGWLGRYFEGMTDTDGSPLAGLSVGRSLPAALRSPKVALPSVEEIESYSLRNAPGDPAPEKRQTSLMRLYDLYQPTKSPFAALLDTTIDKAYQSASDLQAAHRGYQPAVTYPDSSLASGLQLLAELIHSGGKTTPLRVGHVNLGGFDTHTQQTNRLSTLLTETSDSISAFWQDIVAHGHGNDVLVMTWTEFGRRVPENGNNGTDHGTAGNMFVLGGTVKGGFYGEPPSLTNLDNGNLRYTTDFRSVYATVLERWLQAPADAIMGERFDQLTFITS